MWKTQKVSENNIYLSFLGFRKQTQHSKHEFFFFPKNNDSTEWKPLTVLNFQINHEWPPGIETQWYFMEERVRKTETCSCIYKHGMLHKMLHLVIDACNENTWYATPRGHEPQVENHCFRQALSTKMKNVYRFKQVPTPITCL